MMLFLDLDGCFADFAGAAASQINRHLDECNKYPSSAWVNSKTLRKCLRSLTALGVKEVKPIDLTHQNVSVAEDILPRLTDDEISKVENLALKVHNAIGCRGISRTEFIYNQDEKKFYILEINTQPGMTPTSLVPEIAKFHGISFDELINWILNDASTNR